MTSAAILAIRPADADDTAALARLAALDSADLPAGPLLLGVVDGRPIAALSLADGTAVADPFAHSAELVALMRQRAGRLATPAARRRRRSILADRLRRGSPAIA